MRRMLYVFICLFMCPFAAWAADYDYREILAEVGSRSGASSEDKRLWLSQLDMAAGVSVEATREMFRDAAAEFNVPQILLEAIGYLENNWIQVGPSVDRGWGVMHLVDNDYCQTLNEAAEFLELDPQILKEDPRQNIRGAAALLSAYAGEILPAPAPSDHLDGSGAAALEEWFAAASRLSGLRTLELRDMQARNYFSVIDKGVVEKNVFNQTVSIEAVSVDFGRMGPVSSGDIFPRSPEYPEALSNMTPRNHTPGRRGQKVDTIVEHWMGVGTYAGAISWFHDSRAEASAHFCIRHDDGEVTQVVSINDTAWHSGCPSCPWTNNARSIGVEHEATVTHPEWWSSEPMLDASARLTRFFCEKYGIPLKHPTGLGVSVGIIGHKQVPGCTPNSGCHSDCPGPLPWGVLMDKILAIPL